ncbi:FliG C-terminal domain-containing protein [Falsirhodobacter sp. alg1]|uniref:FliG C-terminal domain-containing protein n=2 Tax=Falsirhodobacter sp. alg1 TaxID=1472418 RepID=UPI0005ED6241|nr:FliG C-terminal domain-containing protein [Falsirhodobacter sp. alg1]
MSQALAQIQPAQRVVRVAPAPLSRPQKAAVIVRLLLSEGSPIPIDALPEDMQADLTAEMGSLRLIDRKTLQAVVAEFLSELESVGLAFPGGMEGALKVMDGHISAEAANILRRAGAGPADPWQRLAAVNIEKLAQALQAEAAEVAAVVISKLPVSRSAEVLGKMPGERARRIAFAMSHTGQADPAIVRRIGMTLSHQLEAEPPKAFDSPAGERVGAILNVSGSQMRDAVLEGLDAEDAAFSAEVRKAIFTFAHIPHRVSPADVPKIIRIVEPASLITALLSDGDTADFLLSNLSQRMAQTLRDEMAERGPANAKETDQAHTKVIEAIRQLEDSGELKLTRPSDA